MKKNIKKIKKNKLNKEKMGVNYGKMYKEKENLSKFIKLDKNSDDLDFDQLIDKKNIKKISEI